jgi:hypothetical protein
MISQQVSKLLTPPSQVNKAVGAFTYPIIKAAENSIHLSPECSYSRRTLDGIAKSKPLSKIEIKLSKDSKSHTTT